MAARNPQTQAKRARELAVKEKRERKREKKAQAAARKLEAATEGTADLGEPSPVDETDPD